MPSPPLSWWQTVDALKNRARAVHYIRAKIRTDGTGNKYEEKEEGETLTASSSSCTPNPSLTNDTVAPCKNKSAVRQSEAVTAHLQVVCLDAYTERSGTRHNKHHAQAGGVFAHFLGSFAVLLP